MTVILMTGKFAVHGTSREILMTLFIKNLPIAAKHSNTLMIFLKLIYIIKSAVCLYVCVSLL